MKSNASQNDGFVLAIASQITIIRSAGVYLVISRTYWNSDRDT